MTALNTNIQQGLPGCEHRGGTKVTAAGLAEILDISPQSVWQWAKDGVIPRDQRGQYDLVECMRGIYQHQRKVIDRGGTTDSLENLRKEGQRIANERKALDIEHFKGKLINAADVQRDAIAAGKRIRESLDNLVIRIQYELANADDHRLVATILHREINKIGLNVEKTEAITENASEGQL
jgi:phage terminase Nu1 subunit (DNA packaging protein)